MANAYSRLHNYDQPVYQPNLDLVANVLSYKQQKLDTGRQKIQSLYDEFSMLDIYKESDQDYAEERLSQVKNMVDRSASGDLSSDALVRDIASNMDNFIDDNVINAVVSTKNFKSDLSKWNEIKEDEPDRFGEQNYNYALTKAQNYLANDKVGQKYNGEAAFIEYVDVNKLMHENAQELSKVLKANYVDNVEGKYEFREQVTGKRVDKRKMESALRSLIGPKVSKQLQINGWSTYNDLSEDQLAEQYNSYKKHEVVKNKEDISKYQRYLDNGDISEEERSKINKEIGELNKTVSAVESGKSFKDALDNGREYVMTEMYTNRFMNRLLDAYSVDEVLSRKVNESDKFYMEYQHRERELAVKESAELRKTLGSSGKGSSGGVSPVTGSEALTEADGFVPSSETAIDAINSKRKESSDNLRQSLANAGYSEEVQDKVIEKAMYNNFEGVASSKSMKVNIDGKEVTVDFDDDITKNLQAYELTTKRNKDYDKVIESSYTSMKADVKHALKSAFHKYGRYEYIDYRDKMPVLAGMYIEGEDGRLVFVENELDDKVDIVHTNDVLHGNSEEYTRRIFTKPDNELTRAEKATKELFVMGLIADDKGSSDAMRKEYSRIYRDKLKELNADPIEVTYKTIGRGWGDTQDVAPDRITAKPGFANNPYKGRSYQLSDIDASDWEVGTNWMGWGDQDVTSTTPKKIFSNSYKALDKVLSGMLEEGKLLPAPTKDTFDKDSEEATALLNLVSGELEAGDRSVDFSQPPTLIPIYSPEKGETEKYKIAYAVKSTGTDGFTRTETEPIDASRIQAILPLAQTSEPALNVRVPGQRASLGNFNTYLGENSYVAQGDSEHTPTVVQNFQGVKNAIGILSNKIGGPNVELPEYEDAKRKGYEGTKGEWLNTLEGTVKDKVRLNDFREGIFEGDVSFDVVTLKGGKFGVEIKKGGKTLHIAQGDNVIRGSQMTIEELTNVSNKSTFIYNAVADYLNRSFWFSTHTYKYGVDEVKRDLTK